MSGDRDAILGHLKESIHVLQEFLADTTSESKLKSICDLCVLTYRNGKKILVAGNGGSAADAQHLAGELVSRFNFDRPPLSAIALTTDSSILTAISNDYGYKDIFSRQILANGCEGDLFIAISTSGDSENIIEAIKASHKKSIKVIGLTGQSGGKMKDLCDYCICVPTSSTPSIQECHLVIEHTICDYIEKTIFG